MSGYPSLQEACIVDHSQGPADGRRHQYLQGASAGKDAGLSLRGTAQRAECLAEVSGEGQANSVKC